MNRYFIKNVGNLECSKECIKTHRGRTAVDRKLTNNQLSTVREGLDMTFSEAAKFNFLPLGCLVMPC